MVDPQQLAADPNLFLDQDISVQGKALNVKQYAEYTWLELLAQGLDRDETESIAVEVRPKNVQLLLKQCYRVYGVGAGTQDLPGSLSGEQTTMPRLIAYAVDAAPVGTGASGCAVPEASSPPA